MNERYSAVDADGRDDLSNLSWTKWPVLRLGELVTIVSGKSPAAFRLSHCGQFPFVKVDDLNISDKYQSSGREFCDESGPAVPVGSVLFAKPGAAIATNKDRVVSVPLYIDSNLMALVPKSEHIEAEYLYYFILHENLFRKADTSTIPMLNTASSNGNSMRSNNKNAV